MDILNLIISLVSGAVGGNLGGLTVSDKNLGVLGNTIIGLIGGGAGDYIFKALGLFAATGAAGATGAPTGSELDLASILANIGVSGVSGGALTAVIALIKDAVQKKST
jgi:uncharacterized membrane protein YeaQ/YmgE (transglycosylase-associated protein family)